MTRSFLLSMVAAMAIFGAVTPGNAQTAGRNSWCSKYLKGAHTCAFASYRQCMATVKGKGGYCYQNPGSAGRRYRGY